MRNVKKQSPIRVHTFDSSYPMNESNYAYFHKNHHKRLQQHFGSLTKSGHPRRNIQEDCYSSFQIY